MERTRPSTLLALALAVALPGSGEANPQGGVVGGGAAAITEAPGLTTVEQSSDRAIINWQSFNIGSGETTRFIQHTGPGAVALNRVVGGNSSLIEGALQANGGVWLVNPNGVLFGPNARVDVQSLLVTTANILDTDFLAGVFAFGGQSPNTDAGIVNQGTLTIGETGLAALVAPYVRNEGVINGRLGTVILAGAPTFTLDLQGDGLVRFAAASSVADAPDGVAALVQNSGAILADGGHVLLTASAVAGVIDNVINTTGLIEARGVAMQAGRIELAGGPTGQVVVDGRLDAGAADGAAAGSVEITGNRIALADGAVIEASGSGGGGRVAVGHRFDGTGGVSERLVVEPGARVQTDALVAGEGGTISFQAGDELVYAGYASARGGPASGNGGAVEIGGGEGRMLIVGRVDTSAAAGATGEWRIQHAERVNVASDVSYSPGGGTQVPDHRATVANNAINASPTRVTLKAGDVVLIDAAVLTTEDITLEGRFLRLRAPLETSGTVRLRGKYMNTFDDGFIRAARLDLGSLELDHGGTVSLDTAVGELAIGRSPSGHASFASVEIRNRGDLTVGTIDHDGIDADRIFLDVDGTLTILRPIRAAGPGDALILITDRFLNGAGPDALQAPSGRWLVYSVDPQQDDLGGITGSFVFNRDFESAPPDSLGSAGNAFVYQRAAPSQPSPPATPPDNSSPPPEAPQLTASEIAEITRATTITYDIGEATAVSDVDGNRLVTLAPPAESSEDEDLLFAGDGNRELWGLSGSRP